MGFDADIEGLASLEPDFKGVDKVGVSRNTVLESAKRMTDPLRHLKIWTTVTYSVAKALLNLLRLALRLAVPTVTLYQKSSNLAMIFLPFSGSVELECVCSQVAFIYCLSGGNFAVNGCSGSGLVNLVKSRQ